MNVGIIGLGVVGSAVRHGMLKLGHSVHVHDLKLNTTILDIADTNITFICVPTATNGGTIDLTQVEEIVEDLNGLDYKGVVVIKSTVLPGTTDRLIKEHPMLNIAFSPEFLRERYAEIDFIENMDLLPIGTHSFAVYDIVRHAHGHFPKNTIRLTPKEAEYLKYFSNTFNALRVVFANSFAAICKKDDVHYPTVKHAAVLRNNIPDYYLDVNETMQGFGGTCLPKDTEAFATHAASLVPSLKLFQTIIDENRNFPETVFNGMRNREL